MPPKKFPCIAKPKIGFAGKNVLTFSNLSQWHQKTNNINKNEYIVQKYITSNKIYAGHILCNCGKIEIVKIYYEQKPTTIYIHKGALTKYKSRNITQYELDVFSKVLQLNNYHGMCCIDYTYDEYNTIKIFEINPRFGGSLINNVNDFLHFLEEMINKQIIYE